MTNNELLLLIRKHTLTLIEKTKRKSQETLEVKLTQSRKTLSFNLPKNSSEEAKWLLAVTSFEATIVFELLQQEN